MQTAEHNDRDTKPDDRQHDIPFETQAACRAKNGADQKFHRRAFVSCWLLPGCAPHIVKYILPQRCARHPEIA
jgi:hypothetical protein